jgi:hypothetical protein
MASRQAEVPRHVCAVRAAAGVDSITCHARHRPAASQQQASTPSAASTTHVGVGPLRHSGDVRQGHGLGVQLLEAHATGQALLQDGVLGIQGFVHAWHLAAFFQALLLQLNQGLQRAVPGREGCQRGLSERVIRRLSDKESVSGECQAPLASSVQVYVDDRPSDVFRHVH